MDTVITAPNKATRALLHSLLEFVSGEPTLDADDLSDLMVDKADFGNVQDGSITFGTISVALKTGLEQDFRGDVTQAIRVTVSLNRRGTLETQTAVAFESYA